jgi:hypothetical protein
MKDCSLVIIWYYLLVMSKLELYCFVLLSILVIDKAPVYVYNLIHYADIHVPYIQLFIGTLRMNVSFDLTSYIFSISELIGCRQMIMSLTTFIATICHYLFFNHYMYITIRYTSKMKGKIPRFLNSFKI